MVYGAQTKRTEQKQLLNIMSDMEMDKEIICSLAELHNYE
jgi:hypothetical protein